MLCSRVFLKGGMVALQFVSRNFTPMKRIMLLAATAAIMLSFDANAQGGKPGTQQPATRNLNSIDNRAQPGTWRNTTQERDNSTHRDVASPGSIQTNNPLDRRQTNIMQQDTTRPRPDTVRSPNPIPTPPVPPPPPIPRDTPQRR